MHDVAHGRAFDHDPREHVRAQRMRRVVEAQTHFQRARLRVELRIDVVDDAFEDRAGQVVEFDEGALPGSDPGGLPLENLGNDPDLVQLGNRHDLQRWRHVDAFANAEVRDDAVGLRIHADAATDLALLFQSRDFRRSDAQRDEPLPRCAEQRGIVAADGGQVFLLGIDQCRRVKLEQQLPAFHGIAARLRDQPLDPAIDARVHVLQRVLVIADVADRLDTSRQRSSCRDARTNPEVVRHRRVDLDDAGLRIDLIGIYRDQVHAHRRLARLITTIIRVHRCNPVKDFSLARGHGARAGRRIDQPAATDENTRDQRGRDCCQQNQGPVHRWSPPRLASVA